MSLTPPPGGPLFVESLEARIAPTGLIGLTNNTQFASNGNYLQYSTAPSDGHLGFVLASTLGVAGNNLFAIKLTGDGSTRIGTDGQSHSAGDEIVVFNAVQGFNQNNPFLQATNGTMFAFFQDKNGDGQVQNTELVGLAMSKKGSAAVDGNINGDVVTNVTKDGTGIMLTSPGKAGFALSGLTVTGNVNGNILAGGNISGLIIGGSVGNIEAGNITNGLTYNFSGTANGVTATLQTASFKPLHIGANVSDVRIGSLIPSDRIQAGDGGAGALGGSVSNIRIFSDIDGYSLLAGNGGAGSAGLKGGAGGNVQNVLLQGTALSLSNHLITVKAGNGGENDVFKGGIGGTINGLATSFDTFTTTGNTGQQSGDLLGQNFLVKAGDGGGGLRGGRGGDVTNSSIFGSMADDGVVTNGVANAEIQIYSGAGGVGTGDGVGHGGVAGNISQVRAENFNTAANGLNSSILVQGGDGGAVRGGGNLDSVTLLGTNLVLNGGNAGDGIGFGGNGGSISNVSVLNLTNLFTHQLTLNAGTGSNSSGSAGGLGGNINVVTMVDADLALLVINSGTHGNGGRGGAGVGGAGGSVTNLNLTDSDPSAQSGTAAIRSGAGGDGLLGGGIGGDMTDVQLVAQDVAYTLATGTGGSVLANGSGVGGTGGNILRVGVTNEARELTLQTGQSVPAIDPETGGIVMVPINGQALTAVLPANYTTLTGTVTAGTGGNGMSGGGIGGDVDQSAFTAIGNLTINSGNGGTGNTGTAGEGGALNVLTGVSLGGSVEAKAGDGGAAGALAGNGGSITQFVASAQTDITMTAGNGGAGGGGGDILQSGTSTNPLYTHTVTTFDPVLLSPVVTTLTTSNFGNTTVKAGNGSSSNGVGGAGGSVSNFAGYVALGGTGELAGPSDRPGITLATHTTSITAGTGGGGTGQIASGVGGAVDTVKLMGNSSLDLGTTQRVTIDAGSAGAASLAKRGAAGGNVNAVVIEDLDTGSVVHHVAAGDASAGTNRGANGGSITVFNVGIAGDNRGDDIGVRTGASYGYAANQAGGIFAGLGTIGKKSGGVNGSVTDITATAIASIVAGKANNPGLVTLLDRVTLEGNTQTTANADGSFINFATANLVGSVYNNGNGAGAANATTFKQGDGIVAAAQIGVGLNFAPEAELTFDRTGNLMLVDVRQTTLPDGTHVTGTPVVTTPPAFLL